jgi:ABC-type lipoprotein export system ATPase subunit
MILRANGLTKSYRAPDGSPLRVLSDVSMEVGPGQLIVITGASGSGKSTLLNLLGLLEDPDAGEIFFGDTCVTALGRSGKSRVRGASIGFVFQSFLLLPSLTAIDNVLLAARYAGGRNRATRARAMQLLGELGLAARVRHFPPQLSGGEQQRVAFCRAILNDPPLLLADEPTGNLDDENGRVILDQLRRRARAGGSVVVVTHRADVADGATTVLRLDSGRLASGRTPVPSR